MINKNRYTLFNILRMIVRDNNGFIILDNKNNKINDIAFWPKNNNDFLSLDSKKIFELKTEQQEKLKLNIDDFDILAYTENQTSYKNEIYKINNEEFNKIFEYINSLKNQ